MIEHKEKNIMGYEPIGKLIMKLSLPLMASMLIQALYNIVDSIFVAMVSEEALTAVSLAFPIQNLLIAFSIGTGVGINSYLARKLGEKDNKTAEATAEVGLMLSIITWFVFAVLGFFCSRKFLSIYTSDEALLSLSTSYAQIVTVFSFGIFIDITIERIMQATGDSFHPMIIQMSGAITNIILDPIFIFTFGLGVKGAAIATVIGQCVGAALAIYYVRKNEHIEIRIRRIRLEKRLVKEIYKVGLPTIITNAIGTFMVSALNSILISFSSTAVSVFGVYFKLQSFVFMPVFGLSSGMVPIIAYNYGAKQKDRMLKTIKLGTLIALSIMIVGLLIFQLIPNVLLDLFSATEEMMRIGIPALRIISLCFVPAAISIALGSSYQSTGVGWAAMLTSILRQIVILVPSAFILAKATGEINAVWFSFPIAEIAGLITSIILYIYIYKTRIISLENKREEFDA